LIYSGFFLFLLHHLRSIGATCIGPQSWSKRATIMEHAARLAGGWVIHRTPTTP